MVYVSCSLIRRVKLRKGFFSQMPPRRKTYGTKSKPTRNKDRVDRTAPTPSSTHNSCRRRASSPTDVAPDVHNSPTPPRRKRQQRNTTVSASTSDHHSRTPKGSSTPADCEAGHPLTNRDVPTIVKAVLDSLSNQTISSDIDEPAGSTSGSQTDIPFVPSKLQLV